mgnify:CR=1 FL=1
MLFSFMCRGDVVNCILLKCSVTAYRMGNASGRQYTCCKDCSTKGMAMAENKPRRCSVAKKCGGCVWSGVSYKEQLKKKQESEEKLLGGFCKVEPIIGMKHPFHYRNKVHAAFGLDRKGKIISGQI